MMEDVRLAKGEDLDEVKERANDHIADDVIHVTVEEKENWNSKADGNVYAKVGQAGLIKPYSQNNINRSGLVFYDDGSVVVNVNAAYGLSRTGDGKVVTAYAAENDIDEKSNTYKPITPAHLQYAVESIVGKFSELQTTDKTNIINAINELVTKISALENK